MFRFCHCIWNHHSLGRVVAVAEAQKLGLDVFSEEADHLLERSVYPATYQLMNL